MSDDADRAQIEVDTALRIARLAGMSAPKLRPLGRCYNCDDRLIRPEAIFCDSECEKDYSKRRLADMITGRQNH